MTHPAQAPEPLTAKEKARVAASALSRPAPTRFLTFEENGGAYHWMIVARSGETLARFASLARDDEARQAARIVQAGAVSASIEHVGGDANGLSGLAYRRKNAAVRDHLDAERWLDEGGSFSSEPVT